METDIARESGADFAWSPSEIRHVGHRVVDLIAERRTELPAGPVFRPVPAELGDTWMAARLPERGESADAILDRFVEGISPYPFGNGHPRLYGWVNSPPAAIGVLAADLDSLDRQLLEDVQLGGEGFLSGTTLNGCFWLRVCVVNSRASATDIDAVFDVIRVALRRRFPS